MFSPPYVGQLALSVSLALFFCRVLQFISSSSPLTDL
uniref:Uncharacterized protein n=1 Tax=Anguilla anguilla TaxID=7936 RepID=A0A0E9XU54_ANGAN